MAQKEIIFEKSILKIRPDGILHIDFAPDETIVREDLIDLLIGAKQLGKGKKLANLITVGAYTVPDKEARELSVQPGFCKYRLADAFVVNTLSQSIIANFYLKVNKPPVPTRFFKTEKEAVKWLQEMMVLQSNNILETETAMI